MSTVVVADRRREQVVERVAGACREGRQAYWVCTLIEESEALQAQAAEDTAAALAEALDGLKVGLVHGRLKAAEKEAMMAAFKAGGIDLLVIYNSGRFRMGGRGSLAGLMPYGDANRIVVEMAGEVLTVVQDREREAVGPVLDPLGGHAAARRVGRQQRPVEKPDLSSRTVSHDEAVADHAERG